jgi:hypothetical protein
MATPAQVIANGANAKLTTVLPHEDPAGFEQLLAGLTEEFGPVTPTEDFLVLELARAQWKLRRIESLEREILGGDTVESWSDLVRRFAEDCAAGQVVSKLSRYEDAARRAWFKALKQLLDIRAQHEVRPIRGARTRAHHVDALLSAIVEAPVPATRTQPQTRFCDSKPMPEHLRRELDAHKRRDPLFDPLYDQSQMSKELRKYFAAAGPRP